jgi:hypothetical protein
MVMTRVPMDIKKRMRISWFFSLVRLLKSSTKYDELFLSYSRKSLNTL